MALFRLEGLKNTNFPKRHQQILYTKKQYNKIVKITGWEMHLESYPKDNDPYCPGRLNYFLSHYNQLANLPQEPYQSETSSKIVSELHGNKILIAESNKSLINFYSYSNDCCREILCPAAMISATDYCTTMQNSYTMPFPHKIQRFALPTIPFMTFRKMKSEQNENYIKKFYDDDFKNGTICLQSRKETEITSYNPCTPLHSDKSSVNMKKQRICFKLD